MEVIGLSSGPSVITEVPAKRMQVDRSEEGGVTTATERPQAAQEGERPSSQEGGASPPEPQTCAPERYGKKCVLLRPLNLR